MSARALSSATVSFGLVSIPIKVYSSGEAASAVRFNMLHKDCGSRLKQQYVCAKDGEVVSRDDMVKGYEFARGQYVLFSDEELKKIQEPPSYSINILEFIPTKKIDPIYFEKAYYLGPDKGGDRAFKLLVRALRKSGRSALAQYSTRGKAYLVLLRPYEEGVVMQQLRYATEVRSIDEVPLGGADIKEKELQLALQVIEQGVSDIFKPEQYEDEVRKRTLDLIERKVQGEEISAEPSEEPKAQIVDLMEALKASLTKGEERKPAKRAPRSAAGKTAKKTTRKKTARKSRRARA